MSVPQYSAGEWTAVVRPGFVALVGPQAGGGLARALWDAAPLGVVAALDVLARDGLSALPPFAVASVDGTRVYLAVRGDVDVEVTATDGASQVLRAGAVRTWSEQVLESVGVLVVRAAGVRDDVTLPLVDGVTSAGAVRVDVAEVVVAEVVVAEQDVTEQDVAEQAVAPTAAPEVAVEKTAVGPTVAPEVAVEKTAVGPDAVATVAVEAVAAAPAEAATPVGTPEKKQRSRAQRATAAGDAPAADGTAAALAAQDTPPAPQVAAHPEPVTEVLDVVSAVSAQPHDTTAVPDAAPPAPEAPYDVVAAAESFLVRPDGRPDGRPREVELLPVEDAQPVADAATDAVPPTGRVLVPDVPPASPDDHDGLTILSSDLAAIRDQLPSWASDEVPGPFHVPAAVEPAQLRLSTGLVVALDRAVLLGRAPQVARVTNRELPRLVTVPSPQQDISRTHAEVRVEGDHVLVTDLDSTNGVHVSRAGEGARRLHPGEPSVVGVGEVVDLGDGVTFTVERGS